MNLVACLIEIDMELGKKTTKSGKTLQEGRKCPFFELSLKGGPRFPLSLINLHGHGRMLGFLKKRLKNQVTRI